MESMGILSKVYRERAAEIAHRLAAERAAAADSSTGAAPLTLPGWGRTDLKRTGGRGPHSSADDARRAAAGQHPA